MIGERAVALEQLVSIFMLLIGAGCMFGGYRLFAAGAGQKGHNAAPASFFAGFGALLIVAVILLVLGPWRVRYDDVFPMHVLDLNAPPAAIERPQPPPPPTPNNVER
ncbi:MAG TPA: hypothetical protein VN805_02680 [Caulobacteraceae bacterium]|nr:hypothetical protein [Caulobacteraceae bacterium]